VCVCVRARSRVCVCVRETELPSTSQPKQRLAPLIPLEFTGEYSATARRTAVTRVRGGVNLNCTSQLRVILSHPCTAYRQLKFCVQSLLDRHRNTQNFRWGFDLANRTIPFWVSFLFFAARSCQRLNSSTSVATEYIKCRRGVVGDCHFATCWVDCWYNGAFRHGMSDKRGSDNRDSPVPGDSLRKILWDSDVSFTVLEKTQACSYTGVFEGT
jgi:hypothetical protein